ncbi:MAG: hypothetical protein ABS52_08140 [Gemmatimonadetes bacterium SCN 70-22]|nr:MAG: hypothetical protein ABS52_08140 [Gemmatimonadetes bacterium SCN 70-22]
MHESVTVFIEAREVVVRLEATGEELALALPSLTGAAWRAGVLSVHQGGEELQLAGGDALDRAWHAIAKRACTLPEVARALRALGTRPAGGARPDELGEARARFLAPLMQARRRLEGDEPVEWLVAGFDAAALAERVRGAVAAIARERHEGRPAHRRALEARLLDACEPLIAALDGVREAAAALETGGDAQRFVHWRRWAAQLRALFAEADRAWRAMTTVLAGSDRPSPPAGSGR